MAALESENNAVTSDQLRQLLKRYLAFDAQMLQIAIQWRDCYQLIEQYNDEQVRLV